MQRWFGELDHDDVAFVSVVLHGTNDISEIGSIIKRNREATRKRIAAARLADARWNGVYLAGWHEIDAVAADHFPVLPPQRRSLLEKIAPVALDTTNPVWLPGWHGVIRLNGLDISDVRVSFGRQWKLDRQVDVRAFDLALPVNVSLDRITSYGNKFECAVELKDKHIEPWPARWEAEFFGWLQAAQRNPFELLRMTVGPKVVPTPVDDACKEGFPGKEPMPVLHSFSGLSTPNILGAR